MSFCLSLPGNVGLIVVQLIPGIPKYSSKLLVSNVVQC